MTRAVFLDRDGVLNDVVRRGDVVSSPRSLDEFRLSAGIGPPLRRLADAGFRLFVISNQPDVARGLLDPALLARMHAQISAALPVAAIAFCPHDDADNCDCRKPRPGLIRRLAEAEDIALDASFVIGDSWKDVEAGRGAGCRTILLRRDYNAGTSADYAAASLADAADVILGNAEYVGADLHVGPNGMAEADAFIDSYLGEVQAIAGSIDRPALSRMVAALVDLRERGGRLFLIGVGGSAANASHATNDFRKLAGIEAYCPTDNVSELTARVNDEGWDTAYAEWLRGSRISSRDAVLVFSVGGGSVEPPISTSLVRAIDAAKTVGASVLGIVGRDGGHTARVADACVVVPTIDASRVTPHAEAFQAVLWHLLVSHPLLQQQAAKWESVGGTPVR